MPFLKSTGRIEEAQAKSLRSILVATRPAGGQMARDLRQLLRSVKIDSSSQPEADRPRASTSAYSDMHASRNHIIYWLSSRFRWQRHHCLPTRRLRNSTGQLSKPDC